jgi:hypothetical protein
MTDHPSLLQTLVELTRDRDALEILLNISPEIQRPEIQRTLNSVRKAITDLTDALTRWVAS